MFVDFHIGEYATLNQLCGLINVGRVLHKRYTPSYVPCRHGFSTGLSVRAKGGISQLLYAALTTS